jgi:hypothetical protein
MKTNALRQITKIRYRNPIPLPRLLVPLLLLFAAAAWVKCFRTASALSIPIHFPALLDKYARTANARLFPSRQVALASSAVEGQYVSMASASPTRLHPALLDKYARTANASLFPAKVSKLGKIVIIDVLVGHHVSMASASSTRPMNAL